MLAPELPISVTKRALKEGILDGGHQLTLEQSRQLVHTASPRAHCSSESWLPVVAGKVEEAFLNGRSRVPRPLRGECALNKQVAVRPSKYGAEDESSDCSHSN